MLNPKTNFSFILPLWSKMYRLPPFVNNQVCIVNLSLHFLRRYFFLYFMFRDVLCLVLLSRPMSIIRRD